MCALTHSLTHTNGRVNIDKTGDVETSVGRWLISLVSLYLSCRHLSLLQDRGTLIRHMKVSLAELHPVSVNHLSKIWFAIGRVCFWMLSCVRLRHTCRSSSSAIFKRTYLLLFHWLDFSWPYLIFHENCLWTWFFTDCMFKQTDTFHSVWSEFKCFQVFIVPFPWIRSLPSTLTEFLQIWHNHSLWPKYEPIRCWRSKVKVTVTLHLPHPCEGKINCQLWPKVELNLVARSQRSRWQHFTQTVLSGLIFRAARFNKLARHQFLRVWSYLAPASMFEALESTTNSLLIMSLIAPCDKAIYLSSYCTLWVWTEMDAGARRHTTSR